MNPNKFTHKTQEALQMALQLAAERNHQQVSLAHLLVALLEQNDGIVPSIFKKLEVEISDMSRMLDRELAKIPQISGAALAQQYMDAVMNKVLLQAEKQANKLGDDYISTEHLLLAIIDVPSTTSQLLDSLGVTYEKVLSVLQSIRGSHRVTDPEPESKYQALTKYGQLSVIKIRHSGIRKITMPSESMIALVRLDSLDEMKSMRTCTLRR